MIYEYYFNFQFILRSKNQKDLCSASEDRSVRFWKDAISLKSSFFLSESDRLSNEKPLLSFYGHSARVWDCLLLDRFIITSGEVNNSFFK